MSRSPDPLIVQFLNVGQGDAAVVFLPKSKRALVIDAFDENAVLDALAARNVDEIVIFFTHSDEDHVLGARGLLDNFTGRIVGLFYNFDRSQSRTGSDYHQYLRTNAAATRNRPHQPWTGPFTTDLEQHHDFGSLVHYPVRLRILHPTHAHCSGLLGQSLNDQSGVLRVEYQPRNKPLRAVLFAGDVQLTGISLMFEQHQAEPSVLRADVLKFPHHGAWPTTYTGVRAFEPLRRYQIADFLSAVNPQLVVISAGFDNQHGHVRPEVFNAIQALGAGLRIACTQFTQTCTAGRPDPPRPHCADDVVVTFRPNPPMTVFPEAVSHATRIRLHTLPGTAGCDHLLPPLPPPPPPPPAGSLSKGKRTTSSRSKPTRP